MRGSFRGRRPVSIKLLRGEDDPGNNLETKTREQPTMPAAKTSTNTSSTAEVRVLYINGVYAPTALAKGPPANTGATRKPESALNVNPVTKMALLPPSHFEPPTSSTLIPTVDLTPEPLPLMRLQISALVTPKPSADD